MLPRLQIHSNFVMRGTFSFVDLICVFLSLPCLFSATPVVICWLRVDYMVYLCVMFSCSVTFPYEVLESF